MSDKSPKLVTFAVIAYQQEAYIREAVMGAFAQTYNPLEIILSDDCSSDNTYEIMLEMAQCYSGIHTVSVRRNPANLGLAEHVNRVFSIFNGEYILLAAGDDISLPWRTERQIKHFKENPDVVLVGSYSKNFGSSTAIAPLLEDDGFSNLLQRCKHTMQGVQGCTFAYSKRLVKKFPKLAPETKSEDVPYAFRAYCIGKFELVPEVLVLYRQHASSYCHFAESYETILRQVRWHCSVIDQHCEDLKNTHIDIAEIASGLVALRKREIRYLRNLSWHKSGTILSKLCLWLYNCKIYKAFLGCSPLKRVRRRLERKKRLELVEANWEHMLKEEQTSTSLPEFIRQIIFTKQ